MKHPNTFVSIIVQGIVSAIMAFVLIVFGSIAYGQQIYSGPAFGQISGGSQVSTTQFKKPPKGPDSWKLINAHWERHPLELVDDMYNKTPAAAPLHSNEFLDSGVISNPKQEVIPPAVVIDHQGNPQSNSIPPDPIMAAGPNHIITMVNSSFIIWDKRGNMLFQIQADTWFSNVLPYNGLFDPVIIYDHFDQRWVMLWDLQDDNDQSGYWVISVSDDADPMGTWCNYLFAAHLNGSVNSFTWGDYPKMGYDHQAIYVTGRQFSFSGFFQYSKLRIIPKSQLYDAGCGPVDYTDFWNFRDPNNPGQRVDGPPVAATHLDSTNNIAYLVVDSPYTTSTFITLWTLSDPLGSSPALSAVNIPITAALRPPDANQLGGGSPRIDSGRRAYRNAVYKDGNIWTATAIAGGSGNAYAFARYLRLDVDAHSAIEDVALGADGFYYLYPAIMVDEDDNMVMVFTRSGDSEYAGVAYTGRRDFDPPGLSPSVLLKPGEANYVKTFGGSRNRWGDYMGIALDPDNPNTIWGLIEFADSPANTWGTWVGAFTYQYMASGIVKDAQAGTPIEFANIEVVETGRVLETDSTGMYTLGSPSQNISLNITAFAYQDTTASLTLTLYNPDTLDILLEPEIEATISGQVKDSLTGTGIPAELAFYARGNPYPGPYVTTTTDPNGFYNVTTIIGTYDIVVTPEIPYPVTTINDVLLDPASLNLNIELLPADVFLINDDVATDNEIYFQEALDSVGATYFTWRISESGIPDSNTIALFPDPKTILWYTGNADVSVLSDAEQQSLSRFLDNGGKLLLTGQNIAETSSSGVLLSNYLGVDFDTNINPPIIKGVDGDLLGDGLVLSTVGGAGNQNSKDAITVTGNAITSLNYGISTPIGIAGIRTESTPFNWKAVFFGFGLEGINNTDGKRDELLRRSLVWFDVLTGIGNQPQIISKNLPENFELEQNYPNPFNPSTTIKYHLAKAGDVVLLIYNQLGQQVKQLVAKRQPAGSYKVQWDGKDDSGKAVASGIYVYHLRTEDYRQTRKMILLK